MTNYNVFLSDPMIHALGWTLVHSLWQAAAAALVLWMLLPRLADARRRYAAAYATLMLVFGAALLSFAYLYDPEAPVAFSSPALTIERAPDAVVAALPESSFWHATASRLESRYPAIVSLWLLGFGFFVLRLAGGLHYLHRLRRNSAPIPAEWLDTLHHLAGRLRQTRPVTLLESALIRTPMALGFFKPLILLPAGWINQLSPAEVEAVLAHELAHIVRRDWLFNLVQALVESLFYYHPAVWWISSRVRAERENCCDDAAVALTGNRLIYAKTLVRLQDLTRTGKHPALALGMDGARPLLRRRPLLLERIKRILQQPQQSSTIMEKTIALAILLALITLLTVRANTPPAWKAAIHELAAVPVTWFGESPDPVAAFQAPADTVKPENRRKIISDDGEKRVEMEMENGRISRLNIDGKDIPAEEYGQYSDLTDAILEEADEATPPTPPTPAMPPAPPGFWEARPGMPAPPAFPGTGSARISTEKDDDGNTLIHVEHGGKPMEIRVRDGEVWIDGKQVEEGETIDIPGENHMFLWNDDNGRTFSIDGQQFYFESPEGKAFEFHGDNDFHFEMPALPNFEFEMPNISEEDMKRAREEALRSLNTDRKEIEKQIKEMEIEMKKNKKEWEKSRRSAIEELEKSREAQRMSGDYLRSAGVEAELAQQRAQTIARNRQNQAFVEMRNAQAAKELQGVRIQRNTDTVSSYLKKNMVKDGLITDENNYSYELSGKSLRINGKKQPDELHQRYLELYQAKTGKELSKKDSIRVEVEN